MAASAVWVLFATVLSRACCKNLVVLCYGRKAPVCVSTCTAASSACHPLVRHTCEQGCQPRPLPRRVGSSGCKHCTKAASFTQHLANHTACCRPTCSVGGGVGTPPTGIVFPRAASQHLAAAPITRIGLPTCTLMETHRRRNTRPVPGGDLIHTTCTPAQQINWGTLLLSVATPHASHTMQLHHVAQTLRKWASRLLFDQFAHAACRTALHAGWQPKPEARRLVDGAAV